MLTTSKCIVCRSGLDDESPEHVGGIPCATFQAELFLNIDRLATGRYTAELVPVAESNEPFCRLKLYVARCKSMLGVCKCSISRVFLLE